MLAILHDDLFHTLLGGLLLRRVSLRRANDPTDSRLSSAQRHRGRSLLHHAQMGSSARRTGE